MGAPRGVYLRLNYKVFVTQTSRDHLTRVGVASDLLYFVRYVNINDLFCIIFLYVFPCANHFPHKSLLFRAW